jgi:hypothetical protein
VTSSIRFGSEVLALRRPQFSRRVRAAGTLGSHGWLCGDRRAALNEFHELDHIENHPTYPQQKDYSHDRC